MVGWSTDSVYSHLAWCNTSRKQVLLCHDRAQRNVCHYIHDDACCTPSAHHLLQGGLGGVRFPMVADITKQISKDYDILIEEGENAGVALRCGARTHLASHAPISLGM